VVSITRLEQDGFGSGQLESIEVSSSGRIVGNYTNGEQLELYEVTLASFNADSMLAKLEGGAFAATSESGAAILGAQGSIVAATLEASNADIADEFSKLIITQQAYAAGTRIVTTADEMMTEALNMVR
jgi:flagellar hook protein FlgE